MHTLCSFLSLTTAVYALSHSSAAVSSHMDGVTDPVLKGAASAPAKAAWAIV